MKTIKSVILIFVIFFCMSFLCSCGAKEVVGPQGPQGEQGIQGPQGVQGEPGRDGTSLLTGNGMPSSNLGKNGDSYIDLDSWNYYVKINNEWISKGNIKSEDDKESEVDHKGTEGLEFYPMNDTECAVAVGTAKLLKQIEIPSKYKDYTVTVIMPDGFSHCNNLEYIVIPESVTSIENNAFFGCSSLTSITIPDSVTSIGSSAFRGCSSLTNIKIPDRVTSIGNSTFDECDSLVFSTYGNAKYLGNDQNPYLVLVDVSDSLSNSYQIHDNTVFICNDAFENCNNLISIVIPNSVTSIGSSAFSYCHSLESIVIPSSVTSLGEWAFSNCSSLTIYCEATSKPSEWNSNWNYSNRPVYWGINETNFYEENGIQYVLNLETKEATISRYVGNDANIVINETIIVNDIEYCVRSIGEFAFKDCSSLKSIVIPDSVANIGESAFKWCSSLESMTLPFIGNTLDGTTNTHFGYIFGANSYSDNNDYVPTSLKEVIITGGSSIGSYVFWYCRSLKSIEIPNSVTSIGYDAFYGCSSLESITIPFIGNTLDGTTNAHFGYIFGASSYFDNSNYVPISLKEVIITGGSSIGSDAFCYCKNLKSIVIPDSVISIGEGAFYECGSLESVYYNGSIEDWCNFKFSYYYSNPMYYAEHFYMKDSNNEYYEVTEIEIPNTVTSIGSYQFYSCDNITSIVIPDSVTSIGEYAFYECSSLENIVIPDSVTSIGKAAFSYCYGLESITIPDSVTSIGESAFYECSSLTIYCEAESKPSGWYIMWNSSNCPVYWAGQWEYSESGHPIPLN